MEKRGSLLTDVDEGGLHAGEHSGDLSEYDVADRRLLRLPLDVQLSDHSIFNQSDAGLSQVGVDDYDISGHVLNWAAHPLGGGPGARARGFAERTRVLDW
jgi:hypothetical protein